MSWSYNWEGTCHIRGEGLLHLIAIYRRVFDLMIGIPTASWRTFIYLFLLLLFRLGREIYTIPTTINLEQLFISILNSIKNEIGNCYSFCCFVLVNKDNFFRRKKRETRGPCPVFFFFFYYYFGKISFQKKKYKTRQETC